MKNFCRKNGINGIYVQAANQVTFIYNDGKAISIKVKEKLVMYLDSNRNILYTWQKIREENEKMLYDEAKKHIDALMARGCLII